MNSSLSHRLFARIIFGFNGVFNISCQLTSRLMTVNDILYMVDVSCRDTGLSSQPITYQGI